MKDEIESLRQENEELKAKIQLLEDNCWFDTADLIRILKCSDSKIARMRKQHLIPFENFGGKYLYPKIHFTYALVLQSYKDFRALDRSHYPPAILKVLRL